MVQTVPRIPAQRILVVMPNWLGDGVMATPLLRELRTLYPQAHIATLQKPLLGAVTSGLPFVNAVMEYPTRSTGSTGRQMATVLRWMRDNHFDLALLLPNSFRSAWLAWRAGIPRRLGYARDGRQMLLTDRLHPLKRRGEEKLTAFGYHLVQRQIAQQLATGTTNMADPQPPVLGRMQRLMASYARHLAWQPLPTIDYYLALATYLGGNADDRKMQLGITPEETATAQEVLHVLPARRPLVALVPGANFGASKCWPPERFAVLAGALSQQRGATSILIAGPMEQPIAQAIMRAYQAGGHSPEGLIDLRQLPNITPPGLGTIKALLSHCQLMVCNDTGPRHFAAALDVPLVTLFGPTDPRWAETFTSKERLVRVPVGCGPCQLKKCPIDHRCMTRLDVDQVLTAALAQLPV